MIEIMGLSWYSLQLCLPHEIHSNVERSGFHRGGSGGGILKLKAAGNWPHKSHR